MPTLVRTAAGSWKAVIRKRGWPTTVKTFRRKRDAQDWARRIEDEMVRGVYVDRAGAERLTLDTALERYLREVTPTKRPSTAKRERQVGEILTARLGEYALAALTPEVIASYRDERLAARMSATTVRIELARLSMQRHARRIDRTSDLKLTKKELARVLTILRQKQSAGPEEAQS